MTHAYQLSADCVFDLLWLEHVTFDGQLGSQSVMPQLTTVHCTILRYTGTSSSWKPYTIEPEKLIFMLRQLVGQQVHGSSCDCLQLSVCKATTDLSTGKMDF